MAGIYIHIPFCRSKCSYCDFFSVGSTDRMEAVLAGIHLELRRQKSFLGVDAIGTIYFGGGTPSIYAPYQIQSVIDSIKELWECSAVGEITMEANPDDLTSDYLEQLRLTDINRLSIGIQSFRDSDLALMNRRHTSVAAVEAVRNAQRLGYDNITIDLIYGVPGMPLEVWSQNVDVALSLGIQHISAYHLSIEEKSRFGRMAARGELSAVDEGASQEQYLLLHDKLAEAGFEHYEISNFAQPGFRARHNSAYWTGQPYLGVGPSAHSFNGRERRWSVSSIVKYLEGVERDVIYESEMLSECDAYNEFIMISLRTSEGVCLERLSEKFGACKLQYFLGAAQKLIDMGRVVRSSDYIFIPHHNFLIADSLICEMFDEGKN